MDDVRSGQRLEALRTMIQCNILAFLNAESEETERQTLARLRNLKRTEPEAGAMIEAELRALGIE